MLAHGSAVGSGHLVPIVGGTVAIAAGLRTAVTGLDVGAGGLVDVGRGLVTVAQGLEPADVLAAIVAGRGDGSWNGGQGIVSTAAASGPRTVGWLEGGDGSIVLGYAAAGDTNLDWQVDILDAANFVSSGLFDAGAYNAPAGLSAVAVPEPSGWLLAIGATVLLGRGLGRGRRIRV
ncbi:MAG: hypothetical protein ACKO40_05150 [Planctomycetaceae bacterium]